MTSQRWRDLLDRARLAPQAFQYTFGAAVAATALTAMVAMATVPSAAGPGLSKLAIWLAAPLLLLAFAAVIVVGNRRNPGEVEDTRSAYSLSRPLKGLVVPFRFHDTDDEAALRVEQVRHCLSQLDILMAINVINALLVVYAIWSSANPLVIHIWFASVVLMVLFSLQTRRRGANRVQPSRVSKRSIRRVALHSGLRGCSWGMPFALFFTTSDLTGQLILLSVSAGMAAGGIPALAPVPAAALLYGLGILFPTLLTLIATGNPALLVLVGFGLTFALALAAVAGHLYQSFTSNLLMRRTEAEQSATISMLLNEFESSASDWLWETDRKGTLVRMPARMSESFAMPAPLNPGAMPNLPALLAATDCDGAKLVAKHFEARTPFRSVAIKTTDVEGRERWTALSASPKESGGWRGVGSDITAKVLAETEVAAALARAERAEQRLKDGIDALSVGFVLTDRHDQTLIANRRFEEILPAAALAGKGARFSEMCALQAGLWYAQDPGQRSSFQELMQSARGSNADSDNRDLEIPGNRWVRVQGAITSEGGVATVLTCVTDIKQQEALLAEQADRLARSNAELQNFATVASHDLQEPLRKIEAFGVRLQKRNEATLDADSKLYLERMMAATQRMRTLITDLLAYSRVTRKNEPFRAASLDKILRDVVEDLGIAIEEKKARVEFGPLGSMSADVTQIRQLAQNLLSNALKFVKPDLPPVIRIERRERPDGSVELRFADNGIGFDMKYHDKIFEIFQRLHGREQYQGTGVGLATCRRIVERHNGTLRAESTPGEGATFIATFPASQMRITNDGATAGEQPDSGAVSAA